jgi:hypothetical protein
MICKDHPTIPISLLITAIKLVFFFKKIGGLNCYLGEEGSVIVKGLGKLYGDRMDQELVVSY